MRNRIVEGTLKERRDVDQVEERSHLEDPIAEGSLFLSKSFLVGMGNMLELAYFVVQGLPFAVESFL